VKGLELLTIRFLNHWQVNHRIIKLAATVWEPLITEVVFHAKMMGDARNSCINIDVLHALGPEYAVTMVKKIPLRFDSGWVVDNTEK